MPVRPLLFCSICGLRPDLTCPVEDVFPGVGHMAHRQRLRQGRIPRSKGVKNGPVLSHGGLGTGIRGDRQLSAAPQLFGQHGQLLLKDPAAAAGVDANGLKQTIARYNGFVKNGRDEDFGRPVKFMKKQISPQGPYYLVEQKPRFATTMGSVVVDTSLHVLGKDGQPIPNLYAAGEIANAVHGDDSSPGANVGWGITSGKAVSDVIVKELNRK